MKYRAEIDGLRAIAVSVVILFHFGVPGFPSGFLGVDAFFVISGYLISRLLLADMEADRFSLLEFYRRRTIRILPALLVMIVLVTAIGIPLLLPGEIYELGLSGASAALYVANVYFQAQSNYFDASEIKPLLHTWSLAVEEQFYIIYPLVLFALFRWTGRHLKPVLWLLTGAGLLLFWAVGYNHPGAAFFFAPTRAWELLLGGVAGVGGFPRLATERRQAAAALLGLALLIAGLLLPPGEPAIRGRLLTTVGTALVLVYGSAGPGARLLSLPPLRWTGAISYSLYLWHLPLRELYRRSFEPNPDWQVSVGLFAVSLLMAILSYHLVEQPIRNRLRHGAGAGRIVGAGLAASVAVAALSLVVAFNAERLRPLPPDVARIAAFAAYKDSPEFQYQQAAEECRSSGREFHIDRCLKFDERRSNVLVFGDSHAGHAWRAIAERFPQDNVMVANSVACRPLFGSGGRHFCAQMVQRVQHEIVAKRRVEAIVLAANWRPRELADLEPTIAEIRRHGIRVTVLGPVMRYESGVPALVARAMLRGQAVRPTERARVAELDAAVRAHAVRAGATYYSMYDAECGRDGCRMLTRTGAPIHFDKAHLTMDGARELLRGLGRP